MKFQTIIVLALMILIAIIVFWFFSHTEPAPIPAPNPVATIAKPRPSIGLFGMPRRSTNAANTVDSRPTGITIASPSHDEEEDDEDDIPLTPEEERLEELARALEGVMSDVFKELYGLDPTDPENEGLERASVAIAEVEAEGEKLMVYFQEHLGKNEEQLEESLEGFGKFMADDYFFTFDVNGDGRFSPAEERAMASVIAREFREKGMSGMVIGLYERFEKSNARKELKL